MRTEHNNKSQFRLFERWFELGKSKACQFWRKLKTKFTDVKVSLATTKFSVFVIIFALLLNSLYPLTTIASTFNKQINYQGRLTNSSGVSVTDGTYNMEFKLYDGANNLLWTETRTGGDKVTVKSGLFSVMLGAVSPLTSIDFSQTLYLGVNIGGTGTVPLWDGEMSPRKILGAVPAAFEADKLDNLDSTQFVRSDTSSLIASSSANSLLTVNQSGAGDVLNLQKNNISVFSVDNSGQASSTALTISNNLSVGGNQTLGGVLTVASSGLSAFAGDLSVDGSFSVGTSGLTVTSAGLVGIGTSTPDVALTVEGDSHLTGNLVVGGGITLGGVFMNSWPAGGGGGDGFWATTTAGVGYPSLSGNYAIVIGSAATTSNVKFEVAGNTKLGGTLQVTGNSILGNASTTNVTVANNLTVDSLNGLMYARNGLVGTTSTSSLRINTDDLVQGSTNLFWSNNLFDIRLAATTSLPNLATLSGLSTIGSSTGVTTILGSTVLGVTNTSALTVAGDVTIDNGANYNSFILKRNSSEVGRISAANDDLTLQSASDIRFNVNGSTEKMILDSTGKLGVGSTSPHSTLSVSGTAGVNPFTVASPSGNAMLTVLQNGNVGIGVDNPASKLTVNGAVSDDNYIAKFTNSSDGSILGIQSADGVNSTYTLFSVIADSQYDKLFGGELLGDTYSRVLMTLFGLEFGPGYSSRDVRIYRSGSNTMTVDDTNSGQANLNVTGKLGVASSSPLSTLSVSGTVGTNPFTIASSSGNTMFAVSQAGTVGINKLPISSIGLDVAGVIRTDSGLRVGNTTDGVTFAYYTGEGQIIGLDASANGYNDLNFRTAATSSMYIKAASGNIGIATSSPSNKLEVAGNTYLSGNATTTGSAYIGGSLTLGSPLTVANGGTGLSSLSVGDLLYGGGSGSNLLRLSDVDTGYVLTSGGTNTAPAWSKVTTSMMSGTYVTGGILRYDGSNISSSSTLVALDNGNVGIGTASPNANLQVYTGINGEALRLSQTSSYTANYGPLLTFYNADTKYIAGVQGIFDQTANGNYGDLRFLTRTSDGAGVTEKMRILYNGNVGIGSTTPLSTLSVSGVGTTNPFTVASSSGSTILTINKNGYLGLGTANPSYLLDMQGAVGSGAQRLFFNLHNSDTSSGSLVYESISAGASGSLNLAHYSTTYSAIAGYAGYSQVEAVGSGLIIKATDASGKINFLTGGSSLTTNNRLTIDSNGLIGISSTTPNAQLSIGASGTTVSSAVDAPLAIMAVGQNGYDGTNGTNGGGFYFRGGNGGDETQGTNGYGGDFTVIAGNAGSGQQVSGLGGSINLTAGDSATYLAGSINLTAGNSSYSGTGGSLNLLAGIGILAGGSVTINAGGTYDGSVATSSVLLQTTGGNVGIGSTTPLSTLSVSGAVGTNPFTVASSSGSAMLTVLPNGNVGIGTNAPTRNLDVYDGTNHLTMGGNSLFFSRNNYNYIWANSTGGIIALGTNGRGLSAGSSNLVLNSDQNSFFVGRLGVGSSTPLSTLSVSGTAGTNPFTVASSTGDAVLTVLQNGYVGIGTANPGDLLELYTGGSATRQYITNTSAGNSYSELVLRNDTGTANGLRVMTTGTGWTNNGAFVQDAGIIDADTALGGGLSIMTRSSAPIRFYTNGYSNSNERMRIDSTGNIGIGTNSPFNQLTLATSSALTYSPSAANYLTSNLLIDNTDINTGRTAETASIAFVPGHSGGVSPSFTIGAVQDVLNYYTSDFVFQNRYGASSYREAMRIQGLTGNVGIGSSTPYSTLSVSGSAGSNPLTVASSTGDAMLTVLQNGYVGIGTANPSYNLDINGSRLRLRNSSNSDGFLFDASTNSTVKMSSVDWGSALSIYTLTSSGAANTGQLYLTGTGLVGVGSSTPYSTLSVSGAVGYDPLTVASSSGNMLFAVTQAGNVILSNSGGIGTVANNSILGFSSDRVNLNASSLFSGVLTIGGSAYNNLVVQKTGTGSGDLAQFNLYGGTNAVKITYTGLAGFGSSTPGAQLSASSSNNVVAAFDQHGTSDIMQLFDSGSLVFNVQDGGYVGIGSSTNTATLAINGKGSASTVGDAALVISAVGAGAGLGTYAGGGYYFAGGGGGVGNTLLGGTSGGQGGSFTVLTGSGGANSSTGGTGGAGGDMIFTTGNGGYTYGSGTYATGRGGDVTFTTGNASTLSTGVGYSRGGNFNILLGTSAIGPDAKGGGFYLAAGSGVVGGDIRMTAGTSTTGSYAGGNIYLNAGTSTQNNVSGGYLILVGGSGVANGSATLAGGTGYSAGSNGGSVNIYGGAGLNGGVGGSLTLSAGIGGSSNYGGNVTINGGNNATGYTSGGIVYIYGGGNGSATSSVYFQQYGGNVHLGPQNGGTAITSSLEIANGGLCVDNDGSCNASTTGRISAVSYVTNHSDLAENYHSSETLEAGDIISPQSGKNIQKADREDKLPVLGVVSSEPGIILGNNHDDQFNADEYPVALSGRVPVKISTENGDIKIGDHIMLSSLPGIGMKATSSGEMIGIALNDFTAGDGSKTEEVNGQEVMIGTVLVFMNLGYSHLAPTIKDGEITYGDYDLWTVDLDSGDLMPVSNLNMNGLAIKNIESLEGATGAWSLSASGVLTVKKVKADSLCLGGTCITETELKTLLQTAGVSSSGSSHEDEEENLDTTESDVNTEEGAGDNSPADESTTTEEPDSSSSDSDTSVSGTDEPTANDTTSNDETAAGGEGEVSSGGEESSADSSSSSADSSSDSTGDSGGDSASSDSGSSE